MSRPAVGELARITAEWSAFRGRTGTVVQRVEPQDRIRGWVVVMVEGEAVPLRFGLDVVEVVE